MKSSYFLLLALAFAVTLLIVKRPQDPICEYNREGNQIDSPFTILKCLGGMFTEKSRVEYSDRAEYLGSSFNFSLGPDLSSCYSDVSCCPGQPESELPVKDFEFPSESLPMRVRRPAHLVDEEYIAKYERAIAIMRQLPIEHPHSFRRQANQHCIYCLGSYNQTNVQFPFHVHRSWLFFPWHRLQIYFHERIIAKIIGDDTFALPYWNWDHPDGMRFPDLYLKGALSDENRDTAHHPPSIAALNYDLTDYPLDPQERMDINLAVMYNQMISGAKKPELFMGCRLTPGEEGMCDGPGTIENTPHNPVHKWVGSRRNSRIEDMGVFYAAARDPVFYAHHANNDRLWTVWKKMVNGDKPEFVDSRWLDAHFYFYDENANLVRATVRDALSTTKLRYVYEEAPALWLNARPNPAVDPVVARNILKSSMNELEGLKNNGPWTLDKTMRVRIDRPKRPKQEDEEEVMVVYGIEIYEDMYVKFDIFVNVIDELIADPRSREFAGSYVHLARGDKVVSRKKHNIKLGISELLEDLKADEDESILVTLVPRSGTGTHTTVDGIRIEYMK